jgi:uncharacterized delta-60 repeat protein
MRPRILQMIAWLAFSPCSLALGAPGDVDPSFVYPRPPVLEPDSTNAIPLGDGFLVIKSRAFESPGSNSALEITRIDEDGRVVTSFGSGGKVVITMPGAVNVATAATRLSNGSILLGGFRHEDRPDAALKQRDSVAAIARLDAQGRLDPAFGTGGVATFDVPGDLDRVGAVNVLPDGRVVAAVWSRTYFDPYDCAHDRVALVRLAVDGSALETLTAWPSRDSFVNDGSCRTTLTMQVLPDQKIFYPGGYAVLIGGELGIRAWLRWDDYEDMVDANRRYGPFVLDLNSDLDSGDFAFVGLSNGGPVFARGDPFRPTFPGPAWPAGLPLGKIAGLPGGITAMQIATYHNNGWYIGFANDFGQAGIAKFDRDGILDKTWGGGDGVVPIVGSGTPGAKDGVLNVSNGLATDVRLIAVQPGGNVVIATADGIIQRLIGQSADLTHGGLVLGAPSGMVLEGRAPVRLTVSRTGGITGAVSVGYRVYEATTCDSQTGVGCPDVTRGIAVAGQDFIATSGRLDWSDGDGTDREITVQTLDDALSESPEKFYVELESATGGAVILAGRAEVTIDESDRSAPPPSVVPAGGSGGGSGGGGAINGLLLVLLAAIALARAQAKATSARHTRSLLLGSTMLAAVAPAAWGGIGDMDSSYGVGGVSRLEVIGQPLQDGRLLYETTSGFGRIDVDGHADATFGNGGERLWPAGFKHRAWAQTNGGTLLAAGTVQGSSGLGLALLRLRADGDIDATFGDGGLVTLPSRMTPVSQSRWVQLQVDVQLDARILVLTEVLRSAYDVIEALELARLLPDGTPDRTFGRDGVVTVDQGVGAEYLVMHALRDGRIRIGGDRLIYLTEAGATDPGVPAADPELGAVPRHWVLGAPTADGGRIIFAPEGDSADGPSYLIARLKSDGSLDRSFGQQGSGILRLSDPPAWSSTIGGGVVWSADGRFLFAALSAGPYRAGLARFRTSGPDAGSLDPAFGNGGIVNLGQMFGVGPSVSTVDGGVVVGAYPTAHFRLLGIDRPSPGFANLASDQPMLWREDQGPIKVHISRLAGSSGPLRVRYSTTTSEPSPSEPTAQPGIDFETVSGELYWADGDKKDKTFSISLLTDGSIEPIESLKVELSSLTPGSWAGSQAVYLAIGDRAVPETAPVPTPTPPSGSDNGRSGGGGVAGFSLLALLSLLAMARRTRRTTVGPPLVSFRNAA